MTRLTGLVAAVLALAVCPRAFAKNAPLPVAGPSTAITVHGRYVYVVQNGTVYKLLARDLKPVATSKLQQPAVPPKAPVVKLTKKPRRARTSRRHFASQLRTTRRPPAPVTEAPLPR